VKKSSLLFCACSLIAVRHTSEELAASLAPKLYEYARSLASTTLLVAPQSIEFFQATLILSMWSTTVGQVPLSIDSWLLSGFALQHSHSSPLFTAVMTQSLPPTRLDDENMRNCYLWNHLCLAHMHYCVGTSRRSMLQPWQIERCRAIIVSDHANNFEVRMVAEIYLYWTVYEHLIQESVDLLKSVAALQDWRRKWEFVIGMLYLTYSTPSLLINFVFRTTEIAVSLNGLPLLLSASIRACSESQLFPSSGISRAGNDSAF
jgi:hypothetical protein